MSGTVKDTGKDALRPHHPSPYPAQNDTKKSPARALPASPSPWIILRKFTFIKSHGKILEAMGKATGVPLE